MACLLLDGVVTGAAEELVTARAPVEMVRAPSTTDVVLARAAADDVASPEAGDGVAAPETGDDVRVLGADQRVGGRRTDDGCLLPRARRGCEIASQPVDDAFVAGPGG